MSSFIQWPTIYGSPYFLPGIILVVLLLALLLLMSSRRRARAERARLAPDRAGDFDFAPPQLAAETGPSTDAGTLPLLGSITPLQPSAPGLVTQPVAVSMQTVAMPMQPVSLATQPSGVLTQPVITGQRALGTDFQPAIAPTAPLVPPPGGQNMQTAARFGSATTVPAVTVPVGADAAPASLAIASGLPSARPYETPRPALTVVPAVASVGDDPLKETLYEIMGTSGDLSAEDMKRLDLFRSSVLLAALETIPVPKSKANDGRTRFLQVRQYATVLESRERAAQGAAAAATAAAPVAPPVAAPAFQPVSPPMRETPTKPRPLTLAERQDMFADFAVPTRPATQPVALPVDPLAAVPDPGVVPASPAVAISPAPPTDPAVTASPFVVTPVVSAPAAEPMVMPLIQKRTPDPADDLADAGALWAEPRPLWGREVRAGDQPEDLPKAEPIAASIQVATPVRANAPAATETTSSELDDFWLDMPVHTLSRLPVKVETAEQLLALPVNERVDMAALLPPAELAATFRATQDAELKKAVIDTLEHIGSPASLNALGNCFEDTSPEIQVYALAAADRLLGVA
jgi:hypothetical protein